MITDPSLIKVHYGDDYAFWLRPDYVEVGPLSARVAEIAGIEPTKELRCIVANLVLAAREEKRASSPRAVTVMRRNASFSRKYPRYLYSTGRVWSPRRRQFVDALDALERTDLIEQTLGAYRPHRRGTSTEIFPGHEFDELLAEHVPQLAPAAAGGVITLKGPKPAQKNATRPVMKYRRVEAEQEQHTLDRINRHVEQFEYEYTSSELESGRGAGTEASSSACSKASSSASSSTISRASSRAGTTPRTISYCGTKQGTAPENRDLHNAQPDAPQRRPGTEEYPRQTTPRRSDSNQRILHSSCVRMNRTFHDNDGRGAWTHGRFYSLAQEIPSRERRTLRIDGEPVVELDISATTPTMLHHLAGREAPEDSYVLPSLGPDYRAAGKAAAMRVFNGYSRRGALDALAREIETGELSVPPGCTARVIIDEFERMHWAVRDQFYSRANLHTMTLDARIAECVMLSFVGSDIACLSVHESFIVPERAEERLYHAIVDAYGSVVASNRRPRLKATYADGSTSYVTEGTYRQRARAFR